MEEDRDIVFRKASRAMRDDMYRMQTLIAEGLQDGNWPSQHEDAACFAPLATRKDYKTLAGFLPPRESGSRCSWTRVARGRARLIDLIIAFEQGVWLTADYAVESFNILEAARFGVDGATWDTWPVDSHRLAVTVEGYKAPQPIAV